MSQRSIALYGFDPGSVNMGVGGIHFHGLVDVIRPDGTTKTIPNITLIHMARWDVTRGIITRPDDRLKKKETIILNPPSIKSEKMLDWGESLADAVLRTDSLFQPHHSLMEDDDDPILPHVLIENQCDFKKTDYVRTQMLQLSNMIASTIQAIDGEKRKSSPGFTRSRRQYFFGLTKYGQRSDASRERVERKEKAVDDLFELLGELADSELPNASSAKQWLDWLNYMESVKEQIHDMCDAVLSVVQKGIDLYKKSISDDVKQKRLVIKSVKTMTVEKKLVQCDIKKQRALLKKYSEHK